MPASPRMSAHSYDSEEERYRARLSGLAAAAHRSCAATQQRRMLDDYRRRQSAQDAVRESALRENLRAARKLGTGSADDGDEARRAWDGECSPSPRTDGSLPLATMRRHEAAWRALGGRIQPAAYADIPWAPCGAHAYLSALQVLEAEGTAGTGAGVRGGHGHGREDISPTDRKAEKRRRRVARRAWTRALLRWHPDKMGAGIALAAEDRERILARASEFMTQLNQARDGALCSS